MSVEKNTLNFLVSLIIVSDAWFAQWSKVNPAMHEYIYNIEIFLGRITTLIG